MCSETQDVSQHSQAQQKVLSSTQKIIERRSARPIIIKTLLSAGRPGWWACEHEKWLLRMVPWRTRTRSKGDVNTVLIAGMIGSINDHLKRGCFDFRVFQNF
jgi:hypothetical protein